MLRLAEQKDFDAIFAIMEASFPKDEYRTRDEQRALLENPRYRVYLKCNASNRKPLGFAAVWELEKVCFLEHLAVDPVLRGGGIGAAIVKDLLLQYGGRICLEVEPPSSDIAVRRIGFYERNGFTVNPYPYIQPAMSKGQNPVPLQIVTSWGAVSQEEFVSLRDLLYHLVYGLYT